MAPPMMAPPMMAPPMMAPPMMAPPTTGAPMMADFMMAAPPLWEPLVGSSKKFKKSTSINRSQLRQGFNAMQDSYDEDANMDCLLECDSAPPEEIKENVDGMKTVAEPGLNEIIDLQLANGSFKMDKVLEKLLSMDEQTLKTKCPSKTEFVEWITALCVVLIETKYSKEKDMWILVTTKGRKYLANASEELDVLLNKATDVVTC